MVAEIIKNQKTNGFAEFMEACHFTTDIFNKDIISMLGVVEQEAVFELTDKIINKNASEALGLLNSIIDEGKDTGAFLINLIEHFRNLMVAKVTHADSKLIDLPTQMCERLLRQAESFSLEEIFSAFNILLNAQEMAKRIDSLRIPLEIGLVRLAHHKKEAEVSAPRPCGHRHGGMPPR